jgi:hypothetical protein
MCILPEACRRADRLQGAGEGHGGRGDVQETWRGLPAPLQDLGMAEYFMALVEQVTEPG